MDISTYIETRKLAANYRANGRISEATDLERRAEQAQDDIPREIVIKCDDAAATNAQRVFERMERAHG